MTYHLKICPDKANPGCTTRRFKTTVALSLPTWDGIMHPFILLDILRAPKTLLTMMTGLDGGHHLDVGLFTSECGHVFAFNNTKVFKKVFLEYVHECWFDAFINSLQIAYMGATRPSSTLNDLMRCKMHGWDGKQVVKMLVLKHFPKFMQSVESLDQTAPYADICTLYQGVWSLELLNFANVVDYTLPPRPINDTNAAAQAWLQQVRDSAHQFE